MSILQRVNLNHNGEGHRVELFTSGGSGNHTYYLPGSVEEVTTSGSLVRCYSAGGKVLGLNTTTSTNGATTPLWLPIAYNATYQFPRLPPICVEAAAMTSISLIFVARGSANSLSSFQW